MNQSAYGLDREVFIKELMRARKARKFFLPKNPIIEQSKFTSMQDQLISLTGSSKFDEVEPLFKRKNPMLEHSKVHTFRALIIHDAAYVTLFEAMTNLACQICYTPISIISFFDNKIPCVNADSNMADLSDEYAFCSSTINSNLMYAAHDLNKVPRFADSSVVANQKDFLFYASVPILMPLGESIGEICVLDSKENYLTAAQKLCLEGLADVISKALTTRHMGVANLYS
jgi:GAF domain-containing protein